MESFLDTDMLSSYARPVCKCMDYQPDDPDSTFLYIETTKLDKTIAEDKEELTDNAWFDCKPPKGLGRDPPPRITARAVQVARIKIEGRKEQEKEEKDVKKVASDANIVSFTKKKAAVEFLSVTSIEDDDEL